MRNGQDEVCGCFPTGRHYPGLADHIAASLVTVVEGLAHEFVAAGPWVDAPMAIIDFETTGLDPEKDRVLEMGVVLFRNGNVEGRHNWLINPGIPVPEESRAVHGISDEDLANAPPFEAIAPELYGLLANRIPVAYNADFDRRFLHAEIGRLSPMADVPIPPALRAEVLWVDPLIWVREYQKYEKGKKLVDVCKRLGIPLEQAHRAAGDAEAAGRVLYALASQMPKPYGELIRLQAQYSARQEAEFAAWRSRR